MLRAAVDAYRARYADVGFGLTRAVAGMPDLLRRLRGGARSTTIIIVTAKPAAVAEPLLEHIGLRSAFDAVYGVPLGPEVEEKSVTLSRALAETATDPAHAVMIGDREHDVRAGRSCGTRTVGVLWGAGDRRELSAAGADHIVAHPWEIESLVSPSRTRPGRFTPGRPAGR
jgi:phosphoglycolate phosphatase